MELIAVICIIGILAGLAITLFISLTRKANQQVCESNRRQLTTMYNLHLTDSDLEHREQLFRNFLDSSNLFVCPQNGDFGYNNSRISCSYHNEEKEKEDTVPFLFNISNDNSLVKNL